MKTVAGIAGTSRRQHEKSFKAELTEQCMVPGASVAAVTFVKPTPPPEIASRADFRVGNRVSFADRNLQNRVGLIVRINQRTATLDCDGQPGASGSACSGLSLTSEPSGRR